MCSCEIYLQNREHGREGKHHIYVSPNEAIIGSDNAPLSETNDGLPSIEPLGTHFTEI